MRRTHIIRLSICHLHETVSFRLAFLIHVPKFYERDNEIQDRVLILNFFRGMFVFFLIEICMVTRRLVSDIYRFQNPIS